jgi:hypothetical protein
VCAAAGRGVERSDGEAGHRAGIVGREGDGGGMTGEQRDGVGREAARHVRLHRDERGERLRRERHAPWVSRGRRSGAGGGRSPSRGAGRRRRRPAAPPAQVKASTSSSASASGGRRSASTAASVGTVTCASASGRVVPSIRAARATTVRSAGARVSLTAFGTRSLPPPAPPPPSPARRTAAPCGGGASTRPHSRATTSSRRARCRSAASRACPCSAASGPRQCVTAVRIASPCWTWLR